MAQSRQILLVNTNIDSADAGNTPNTLRWALEQTQKGNVEDKYEIVFQRRDNKEYSNSFGTGYWTFQLDSPLPTLEFSDIKINFSVPKSIVIIPKNAKKNPDGGYINGKVGNAPLLTISNPLRKHNFYKNSNNKLDQSYGNIVPKVALNEVNFALSTVKGQDGSNGEWGGGAGGGGLGAGAGILLGIGELHVQNSVFQNLEVVGGNGGKGVGDHGAKGGYSWSDFWAPRAKRGEAGKKGGGGGGTGSPLADSSSGTKGGEGGTAGGVDYDAVHGGSGRNAISTTEIGRGGGGGGGGGAGGTYENWGNLHQGNQGRGGNGGSAGFGAGGGGGGGTGGRGLQRKAGKYLYGHGASVGNAGASGDHASNASAGRDSALGIWNTSHYYRYGGRGGNGGNGAALGGAISVLDDNAKLYLKNVDFIGNTANAGSGASAYGTLFSKSLDAGKVKLKDVNFYADINDQNPKVSLTPGFVGLTNANGIHAHLGELDETQSYKPPFHMGTSSIIEENVVKIRDTQILQNKHGTSDTNIISFEDSGSGTRSATVTSDFSDPSNPFHQIHRQLVPDQADKIQQEYQNAISGSIMEAGHGIMSDAPEIIQETLISKEIIKVAEIYDPKIPIVSTIFKNVVGGAYSRYSAGLKRDSDLKANSQRQKELLDFLNNNRQAQIGSVTYDVDETRRLVEIRDFTVGEDIILFPNMKNVSDIAVEALAGGNAYWIKKQNTTSSKSNVICKIVLSQESVDAMDDKGVDYISSLLRRGSQVDLATDTLKTYQKGIHENTWTLSTRQLLKKQTGITHESGPAAAIVRVDRPETTLNSTKYTTITKQGDDQIYGSNGDEIIRTGDGDDLIMPGVGNDIINAGSGIDLVSYTWLKDSNDEGVAINVVGETFTERGKSQERMTVSTSNNSVTLNSTVNNAESIAVFGASDINLKNIGSPEGGIYSIRTGSGSVVNGSKFDDLMIISYDLDENAGSDSEVPFQKTTKIYGNGGNDKVRLLIEDLPDGWGLSPLLLDYNESTKSGTVKIGKLASSSADATFDSLYTILEYEGIDKDNILHQGTDATPLGNKELLLSEELTADIAFDYFEELCSDSKDTISCGDGNDKVNGGDGEDSVYGELGDDLIDGDAGNDIIYGGPGDDILHGDKGGDQVFGGEGNDIISGGSGIDKIYGNNGNDKLTGGDGQDTLNGGPGSDSLGGNLGSDLLYGCEGDDILRGGDGNDTLIGGNGNDLLSGGNGSDVLVGENGSDIFAFENSQNSLHGNPHRDVINDFKSGVDRIDLSSLDPGLIYVGSDVFSGAKVEVRFDDGILQVDTDRDSIADFEVQLNGVNSLNVDDLIL